MTAGFQANSTDATTIRYVPSVAMYCIRMVTNALQTIYTATEVRARVQSNLNIIHPLLFININISEALNRPNYTTFFPRWRNVVSFGVCRQYVSLFNHSHYPSTSNSTDTLLFLTVTSRVRNIDTCEDTISMWQAFWPSWPPDLTYRPTVRPE